MQDVRYGVLVLSALLACGPSPSDDGGESTANTSSPPTSESTSPSLPTTGAPDSESAATSQSTESGSDSSGSAADTSNATSNATSDATSDDTGDDTSTGDPLRPGCADGVPAQGEFCFTPVELVAAANPSQAIAADLDADGHQDLVLITSIPCPLIEGPVITLRPQQFTPRDGAFNIRIQTALGDGHGAFVIGPPIEPMVSPYGNALVGEWSGDDALDLVYISSEQNLTVFQGGGDGTLGATLLVPLSNPVDDESWNIAAGDVDDDGDLDIIAASVGDLRALISDGLGGFTQSPVPTVGPYPNSVALFDLDGDAALDILLGHWGADDPMLEVLLGDGGGSWVSSQKIASTRVHKVMVVPETTTGAPAVLLFASAANPDPASVRVFDVAADGTLTAPTLLGEFMSGALVGQFDGVGPVDAFLFDNLANSAIVGGAAWPPTLQPNPIDIDYFTSGAVADFNEDGIDDPVIVGNVYTLMLSTP